MVGRVLHFRNLTGKALSAFLSVVLSGLLCLCCYQMSAARAAADSCPLKKASHCDSVKNKDQAAGAALRILVKANVSECCALQFNFFLAKLEKNEFSVKAPMAAAGQVAFLPTAAFVKSEPAAPYSYRPPVFDRRGLRVKNCVFRI